MRNYAEVMLTHLCCPLHEHPAVAQLGMTAVELFAMLPGREDDESAWYDFRWPCTVYETVAPALELSEQSLSEALGAIWQWTHDCDHTLILSSACRLASFASHFMRRPVSWAQVHLNYEGESHMADPHKLIKFEFYRCERLPWVQKVRGGF
jgi:hypothetical protein